MQEEQQQTGQLPEDAKPATTTLPPEPNPIGDHAISEATQVRSVLTDEDANFAIDLQKEDLLTKASESLVEKVKIALAKLKKDFEQGLRGFELIRKFVSYFKAEWKTMRGSKLNPYFNFVDIDELLDGIELQFGATAEIDSELSFNRNLDKINGTIILGLGELYQLQSDRYEAVSTEIQMALFHEIEHILYPGTDLLGPGKENSILYLANPGEMRAFAKQYAYLFTTMYPGEPFNPENLLALCNPNDNRAKSYFSIFADPQKQQKYANIADLKAINGQMVSLTSRFVDYLNSRKK